MKPVREIVGRDVIDDLWGAGYTILPRKRHVDPFFVPPEIIPQGRSYQWWHLVHDRSQFTHTGWAAVPAERHDGYFMPAGFVGNIEVMGLGLFDKPKHEVDAERNASHAKAHQNVADWIEKHGGQFSGSVTVGDVETGVGDAELGKKLFPKTKTIETTVSLPQDMLPHMEKVFAERDRLHNDLIKVWGSAALRFNEQQQKVYDEYITASTEDPGLLRGPALNALLLPYAVENVRKQLKEKS